MNPRCINCNYDLAGQLTQTGRVTCPECGTAQGITETADLVRRRSRRLTAAILLPGSGYLVALICFFFSSEFAVSLIVLALVVSAVACLSILQTSDKPRLRWAHLAGYFGAWLVFQTACVVIVVAIFVLSSVDRP
jgi:hypothetical protein